MKKKIILILLFIFLAPSTYGATGDIIYESGSVQVNVIADPGINKAVITEEFIVEIYEWEAMVMLAILSWTFFMRVLGRRSRPKNKVF